MISGMESFREYFQGYEDCYTIIGGAACDILMHDAALSFRATKDIDMILLIENRFEAFATLFWKYIKAGGYRCGWKSAEKPHFYRFTEPQKSNFPVMIELFSRRPDFQSERSDVYLTPLPVSDEVSSLSAIMLDEDYYKLMLAGRRTVEGISILGAEYLILFKIKAWLDLTQKKTEGLHFNERDLKKHKNDVFRLFALVDPTMRIELTPKVRAEVEQFLARMEAESVKLTDLGIQDYTADEVLAGLRMLYI